MQAEFPAGTVKENWNVFKSIMYKVSKEKIGVQVRKRKDWFNWKTTELEELINNRNLNRNNELRKNIKSAKAR